MARPVPFRFLEVPMRARCLLGFLLTALSLGLVLPGATGAGEKARLPFLCFTQAWDDSFEVLGARLDRNVNRVTWQLKARKNLRIAAYEAYLADSDGVEQATLKVKFEPNRVALKKGARINAVISLGALTTDDVTRLTIRKHP
jgi:hypothetical protein